MMKVDIYYNLHKHCLSVRHKGKIVEHADSIVLRDCQFVVQPGGRARVLKEKRKNVHAFVRGHTTGVYINGACERVLKNAGLKAVPVMYNPYKFSSFVTVKGEKPIDKAEYVVVQGKRVTAYMYEEAS